MELVSLSLALGLVFHCVVVQGQLSVTWKGNNITGPVLIYHDEIHLLTFANTESSLHLTCRSAANHRVAWHLADGTTLSASTVFTERDVQNSRLLRTSNTSVSTASHNGLWTCRLNGAAEGAIPVGLYQRGGGFGHITTNQVSLSSSSFLTDPPTFTLVGDTSGGPPTTYTWTRDGVVITDGGSFSISLSVNESSPVRFRDSVYVSTLTVTGRLPGEYNYAVTNRATSPQIPFDSINIEGGGGAVTDITAEQTELTTVLVTWTAPSPAPPRGYQVTVASASINEFQTVSGTSNNVHITISQPGVHTIQVLPLSASRHYPSEAVSVEVTVRGYIPPVVTTSSLTATSVTISWTQPEFSLPVSVYTVSLTRVTGSGQVLCPGIRDERPAVTTNGTTSFTGLEEYSVYMANITAVSIGIFNVRAVSIEFTTLSAASTGAPRNVIPSTTSRSVMVTWDAIECIDRNGEITGYTVEFQEQGEARVPGEVTGQSFTASGLTPDRNYTFRVTGVNINGTGPFTETSIFVSEESSRSISTSAALSISVVVTFLLTILLYTTVLLVVCAVCRHSQNTKGASERRERGQVPAIYEEVDTIKVGADTLEMKVNAAYGPVSVLQ